MAQKTLDSTIVAILCIVAIPGIPVLVANAAAPSQRASSPAFCSQLSVATPAYEDSPFVFEFSGTLDRTGRPVYLRSDYQVLRLYFDEDLEAWVIREWFTNGPQPIAFASYSSSLSAPLGRWSFHDFRAPGPPPLVACTSEAFTGCPTLRVVARGALGNLTDVSGDFALETDGQSGRFAYTSAHSAAAVYWNPRGGDWRLWSSTLSNDVARCDAMGLTSNDSSSGAGDGHRVHPTECTRWTNLLVDSRRSPHSPPAFASLSLSCRSHVPIPTLEPFAIFEGRLGSSSFSPFHVRLRNVHSVQVVFQRLAGFRMLFAFGRLKEPVDPEGPVDIVTVSMDQDIACSEVMRIPSAMRSASSLYLGIHQPEEHADSRFRVQVLVNPPGAAPCRFQK